MALEIVSLSLAVLISGSRNAVPGVAGSRLENRGDTHLACRNGEHSTKGC